MSARIFATSERVDQIRFAGGSFLSLVLPGGKKVGAPEQIEVRLRMVPVNLFDNVFDANHSNGQ